MGQIDFLYLYGPWWAYALLFMAGILLFVHFESNRGLSTWAKGIMVLCWLGGSLFIFSEEVSVFLIGLSYLAILFSGFLLCQLAHYLIIAFCFFYGKKDTSQWQKDCEARNQTNYPGDSSGYLY